MRHSVLFVSIWDEERHIWQVKTSLDKFRQVQTRLGKFRQAACCVSSTMWKRKKQLWTCLDMFIRIWPLASAETTVGISSWNVFEVEDVVVVFKILSSLSVPGSVYGTVYGNTHTFWGSRFVFRIGIKNYHKVCVFDTLKYVQCLLVSFWTSTIVL